ncbi:MAG: hypothetical protein ABW043_16910 [Devosia sp.]|uniref:hypothetical protein n=1 Tax=Devosia sp. TaxID=1871048 RepID=UPI00339748B3
MSRTLKTTLMWHDSTGSEVECDVVVEYDTYAGYAGDRIDPPEPAHVEICGVSPVDRTVTIPDYAIDHELLADECMEDWHDDQIAGEEYRAEMRAESLAAEHRALAQEGR